MRWVWRRGRQKGQVLLPSLQEPLRGQDSLQGVPDLVAGRGCDLELLDRPIFRRSLRFFSISHPVDNFFGPKS